MECLDLESSHTSDGESAPVDFLQEMQQNISKFQTLLENLGSRVEKLENTTSTHTQNCSCMRKAIIEPGQSPASSSPSNEATVQRHEIVRLESTVNELKSNFGAMRNDLKLLTNTIAKLTRQAPTGKKTGSSPLSLSVSSSSAGITGIPSPMSVQFTQIPTSVDQRSAQPRSSGQALPPPLLRRAPPPTTSAKDNPSFNRLGQQKLQLPTAASVTITRSKIIPRFDNESDDDMSDDEYEGEENERRQVDDEGQDDSFMHIQPEVILQDEGDDEFEEPDCDDLDEGDKRENIMEDEFGGRDIAEDEGPEVNIEFRDKLGNIVACLAYPRSGRIDCPACETRCMSRKNIIRHYNNKHADPKYYECSVCGAVLNRKDSLSVHLKNQHNIILAPSTEESQLSPTPASDSPAPKAPKAFSGIQYSCNFCGKSFSRADALTAHNCAATVPSPVLSNGLVSPSTSNSRPLKPAAKVKKQVTQRILNPVIAKKCPICPNTFAARNDLLRHLKAHTLNNQCVVCAKNYSRRDKLRGHQRKQHGQVVDDNYIEQMISNPTLISGGDESDTFGYDDLGFDLDGDPSLLSTPLWTFS